MIITKIKLEGAAELDRKLLMLGRAAAGKIVRPALRAGAKVIQVGAKTDAPKRTGKMARAIRVRAMKSKRKGTIGINVTLGQGFFRGDEFYGAFQEFGWKTGKRSGGRAAAAKRVAQYLRMKSRAARSLGPGAGLAKKGTPMRARQERFFLDEAARQTSGVKERRKIEGKHFMKNASDRLGKAAADVAVRLMKQGIEAIAK